MGLKAVCKARARDGHEVLRVCKGSQPQCKEIRGILVQKQDCQMSLASDGYQQRIGACARRLFNGRRRPRIACNRKWPYKGECI